jgi:Peptidase family S41
MPRPKKAVAPKKSDAKKRAPRPRAATVGSTAPAFLRKMSTAVRDHFAGAVDLPTFLASVGGTTAEERKLIVRQALILLEQNYAHLPLKRAMHSIDPVQRLRLLLQSLELTPEGELPPEVEFHREMTDVFTSVRDLHTNYLLPAPFNGMTAFLPFLVEDYFEGGRRRYVVSHVAQGFSHPTFKPGVEVTYWNGTPIDRAVWANAQRYAGSNRDARHARGVQSLTTRALRIAPPPDEEWVVVGYLPTPDGPLAELRFEWMVNPALPPDLAPEAEANAAAFVGLDLEQSIIGRVRLALFAPQAVAAAERAAEKKTLRATFGDLESSMPTVFQARSVDTPAGTFGYLRIYTFGHWPTFEFVDEFVRLVSALPPTGLIIDVRANGGGVIMNGELILQTLTPRRVEPEPVQFLNTPLNLAICARHDATSGWTDLSPWVDSMRQALRTGATYSGGFPISDPVECNTLGQKFFGPVVLITDALCYSTTDIFAAGFQDHAIGPVLGVDGNTGAGGANVWEHRHFVESVHPGGVYQPLPRGSGMRVSIRRTLRVGKRAGTPVEDLGVVPDVPYRLTRDDLLNANVDLINRAGELLAAAGPPRRLEVTVEPNPTAQATVTASTAGMTRLDVYIADRPVQTLDLPQQAVTFTVTKPAGGADLEIRGFDRDALVARYRTRL